jgi:hypothetical protein
MAIGDRLKDLRSKAEEAVVEHKDQINQAVQKAGAVADQRTGGRYREQIQRVGGKATGIIDGLDATDGAAAPGDGAAAERHAADRVPPAGG